MDTSFDATPVAETATWSGAKVAGDPERLVSALSERVSLSEVPKLEEVSVDPDDPASVPEWDALVVVVLDPEGTETGVIGDDKPEVPNDGGNVARRGDPGDGPSPKSSWSNKVAK